MRMRLLPATPALADQVRNFVIVETAEAATRLLMPEPSILLGIRYGGYAEQLDGPKTRRLPQATLTGLRDTARSMHTSAGGGILLAAFRPAGAAQFFDLPAEGLFGTTLDLASLVADADLAGLCAAVAAARDDLQRVDCLERFLLARRRRPADMLVSEALRAIENSVGTIRIAALASDLGVSVDWLAKRFRRTVGATPKQLASIIRMRHALSLYGEASSLTRLSVEAGYADQSHFIREFRSVTGQAPRRLLKGSEYC
ncbi:helix-turn-helix domain-containing protein [Variovorax paradoxus]|nr:AraC family transcriptional regulator [Variovorax paradoxus]